MTDLIYTDFGGEECLGNELVKKALVLRSLKTCHMTPICCVTVSSLVTSPDQIGTAALYSAVWVFIIYIFSPAVLSHFKTQWFHKS